MDNEGSAQGWVVPFVLSFALHGVLLLGQMVLLIKMPKATIAVPVKSSEGSGYSINVSVAGAKALSHSRSNLHSSPQPHKQPTSEFSTPTPSVPAPQQQANSESNSQGEVQALRASNPAPPYPRVSRMGGEQGRVVIAIEVGADGVLIAAKVKESSGYELLDRAALDTVKQWQFKSFFVNHPATEKSRQVLLPFRFSLSGLHETNRE